MLAHPRFDGWISPDGTGESEELGHGEFVSSLEQMDRMGWTAHPYG
jgi:hypothetical protein